MLNGLNNFSIPKVSSVILVVYVSIEEYKTININLNISNIILFILVKKIKSIININIRV